MVLEPFSAFAVACNVIQVLEVGFKLILGVAERTKDGIELSKEHQELQVVSERLQELSHSLGTSLPSVPSTTELAVNQHHLLEANRECLRISRQFVELLDRLKVKERSATFENIKMTVKAYWLRDKIGSMQKALSQARDNLNFAFMLYMNSQQNTNARETQDKIQGSNDELEEKIKSVMESSSRQVKAEIRKVAEELSRLSLASEESSPSAFLSSDGDILRIFSEKLESIYLLQLQQQNYVNASESESHMQQKVLDSLQFPDMYQRFEQVAEAQKRTYEWMLHPTDYQQQKWTCFNTWLQAPEGTQSTYWVQGKPGSGKSTLLKYLDKNLDAQTHMNSWCCGMPVYRARFFFWQTGSTLQKSLDGFYRSILFELLSQRPDLISASVGIQTWRAAQLPGTQSISWTTTKLQRALHHTISVLCTHTKVFLLVDGLDEFEGSSEEQEHLVDFLKDIGQVRNLKICVSSRPWNVFQDAFGQSSQLRLEELTRHDMMTTIISLFEKTPRWRHFCAIYTSQTDSLVGDIIDKAGGVFLWVRLVMQELVRGISDGDSFSQLQQRLSQIPGDLNDYFKRMLDSIEPSYLVEASKMLQLACYQETEFVRLSGLRCLELSFVEEQTTDFAVRSGFDFKALDVNNLIGLKFRLDSTLRKLNSRCVGLLECTSPCPHVEEHANCRRVIASIDDIGTANVEELFNLRIDLVHRSLKEFLEDSQWLKYLHHYTDGPLNVREFCCSAQLSIFMALSSSETTLQAAVRFASYLLTALSIDGTSQYSAKSFSLMQTNLVRLAEACYAEDEFINWYIQPSLSYWEIECSNEITIAIDFNLTSYVLVHLTAKAIEEKKGRPILDYILRPRFAGVLGMRCANRRPNNEMLRTALAQGADPNAREEFCHASTWEKFLCFWTTDIQDPRADETNTRAAFIEAATLLLRAGARPVVEWRSVAMDHPFAGYDYIMEGDPTPDQTHFKSHWPDAAPLKPNADTPKENQLYRVSSLLVSYKQDHDPAFDALLDELKVLEHKYIQEHGL